MLCELGAELISDWGLDEEDAKQVLRRVCQVACAAGARESSAVANPEGSFRRWFDDLFRRELDTLLSDRWGCWGAAQKHGKIGCLCLRYQSELRSWVAKSLAPATARRCRGSCPGQYRSGHRERRPQGPVQMPSVFVRHCSASSCGSNGGSKPRREKFRGLPKKCSATVTDKVGSHLHHPSACSADKWRLVDNAIHRATVQLTDRFPDGPRHRAVFLTYFWAQPARHAVLPNGLPLREIAAALSTDERRITTTAVAEWKRKLPKSFKIPQYGAGAMRRIGRSAPGHNRQSAVAGRGALSGERSWPPSHDVRRDELRAGMVRR